MAESEAGLGEIDPRELDEARLAMHWAAQPLAACAYALLPTAADHTHSNLFWMPERARFFGRPLPSGHRAGFDPGELRLGLLDGVGEPVAVLEMAGRTLEEVLRAWAEALRAAGEPLGTTPLGLPRYDLPDAPYAHGEPFPSGGHFARIELCRWLDVAETALRAVAASRLAGAELRTWPHHFDMAALMALDPEADPETARSVGAGFSPGDGSIDEPYFYVSPWPAPAAERLGPLPDGWRWHTEGFTSAVTRASDLLAHSDRASRSTWAAASLEAAVDASRAALES